MKTRILFGFLALVAGTNAHAETLNKKFCDPKDKSVAITLRLQSEDGVDGNASFVTPLLPGNLAKVIADTKFSLDLTPNQTIQSYQAGNRGKSITTYVLQLDEALLQNSDLAIGDGKKEITVNVFATQAGTDFLFIYLKNNSGALLYTDCD